MSENIVRQLEEKIIEQLDLCNTEETPTVCMLTSSQKGKDKVVELIKRKIIQQKITIRQSILDIELEFNINSTDN